MAGLRFAPVQLAALIGLVERGALSSKMAKDVFEELYASGKEPARIVEEKGLSQVSDAGELEGVVAKVLADNPEQVAQFKGGRDKVLGFFVGQVMKATGGQANPAVVNDLLRRKLAS